MTKEEKSLHTRVDSVQYDVNLFKVYIGENKYIMGYMSATPEDHRCRRQQHLLPSPWRSASRSGLPAPPLVKTICSFSYMYLSILCTQVLPESKLPPEGLVVKPTDRVVSQN